MKSKFTNSLRILFIVLTLTASFTSCKKDDNDKDVATDPTTILTAKTWEIATAGVDFQTSDATLLSAALAYEIFYEVDDYKFQSGGVLKYTNFMGSEVTGTWTLSADFKILTTKDATGKVLSTFTILEAKSSSLKMKKTYAKADLKTTSDVDAIISFIPKS